ncbi:unnamed protein product [Oikopleura dioica]|uniref:Uncharacterized protein n=1 Tax=Oikopleura dioica TaxID=34765 RepID=E4WR22_OIKDI|nr:unnamed protein product [Oikopleura dioica]
MHQFLTHIIFLTSKLFSGEKALYFFAFLPLTLALTYVIPLITYAMLSILKITRYAFIAHISMRI